MGERDLVIMQPVVYLPIEIKARELPSRLVIARRLLEAGYAVAVGNQWSLTANMRAIPVGVFMFKTMNKIQGSWMADAKAAGHSVVANDEEVLNFIEPSGYLISFSDVAAANCDLFFAQSPAHAAAVTAAFPALAGKMTVAGNPRVDLMIPRNRAAFAETDPRINPLKPYILINTNYGSINSIWEDDQKFFAVAKKSGAFDAPNSKKKTEVFWKIIAWERKNYEAMVALLSWMIPRVKGISLVVRPHPIERSGHWEGLISNASGVAVIPRSDPHPWLLNAELVVHTGCTTGVEAALFDRPTLNLLPSDHPIADGLVNYVNPTFRTPDEAAGALKRFLVSKSGPLLQDNQAVASMFQRHLPHHRDGAACAHITDGIIGLLRARFVSPLGSGTAFSLPMNGPYRLMDRHSIAKDKFSATEDEMVNGLEAAAHVTKAARPYRISTLDESAFLLIPA